jgi:hypothetical protein
MLSRLTPRPPPQPTTYGFRPLTGAANPNPAAARAPDRRRPGRARSRRRGGRAAPRGAQRDRAHLPCGLRDRAWCAAPPAGALGCEVTGAHSQGRPSRGRRPPTAPTSGTPTVDTRTRRLLTRRAAQASAEHHRGRAAARRTDAAGVQAHHRECVTALASHQPDESRSALADVFSTTSRPPKLRRTPAPQRARSEAVAERAQARTQTCATASPRMAAALTTASIGARPPLSAPVTLRHCHARIAPCSWSATASFARAARPARTRHVPARPASCCVGSAQPRRGPQRLQRRRYAKLAYRRVGKKGWGLIAMSDVEAGGLITEYCGEVRRPLLIRAAANAPPADYRRRRVQPPPGGLPKARVRPRRAPARNCAPSSRRPRAQRHGLLHVQGEQRHGDRRASHGQPGALRQPLMRPQLRDAKVVRSPPPLQASLVSRYACAGRWAARSAWASSPRTPSRVRRQPRRARSATHSHALPARGRGNRGYVRLQLHQLLDRAGPGRPRTAGTRGAQQGCDWHPAAQKCCCGSSNCGGLFGERPKRPDEPGKGKTKAKGKAKRKNGAAAAQPKKKRAKPELEDESGPTEPEHAEEEAADGSE